eukprot:CAMPEP_0185850846 /NCGR_PEP_ID=MMETSP1354-20130828/4824_1 /TAXON_ID=708628 /ORGANISM="Erythrolobus madagascarensis, Strain CCMP3276" /LENGTH=349 /DNA_ID=CAMNT_0028551571 /DNA_START=1 /DNA_END=1050 /DNA_ORIENTATION=+
MGGADATMNGKAGAGMVASNNNNLPSPDDAPISELELRREVIVSLSVCAFYILVSSVMVFSNKALAFTYGFTMTNALLLMQMMFTIGLLHFLRDVVHLIDFPRFELSVARSVSPVSFFYCLNAAAALLAVRELSVPSYTMVKRSASLFSLVLEFIILNKRPRVRVVLSLIVMVIGTVIAAISDSLGTRLGWAAGVASCLFQGIYLAYVKKSGAETGLGAFGVLYYHSVISLPILVAFVIVMGEVSQVLAYPQLFHVPFLVVLFFSLSMGVVLNYALFLATEKTSPTSTLVSGQVKSILQTAVGMFTFGGGDTSPRYLFGTLLNISGGIGYGVSKYLDMRERQQMAHPQT